MAMLLEMSASSAQLAQAWERMMRRSELLDGRLRGRSIMRHAAAINETVQGWRRCSEAGVQACRCDLMLGDEWDDAHLGWSLRTFLRGHFDFALSTLATAAFWNHSAWLLVPMRR